MVREPKFYGFCSWPCGEEFKTSLYGTEGEAIDALDKFNSGWRDQPNVRELRELKVEEKLIKCLLRYT